ncbi:ABC transporter permease [Halobacteriales archaeon QH_7_65_31]|nr:MAG: ABC transporter permease [Halobacteriales archaeon QH_7_65_31]
MSAELETEFGDRFTGDTSLRRVLLGVVGLAGFLLVWQVGSLLNPNYVLPGPIAVIEVFIAEVQSGEMVTALGQSVRHWLPGTVVGTTLGIALGVTTAYSSVADDLAAPLVRVLRPVPPLALIGFAIAWFEISTASAAFIVAAGAFWINYYAAYGGVDAVPEAFLDVSRSLGVTSHLTLVRRVVLPAAAPQIITGIRTGIGRCWMLIIAAETFGVPGIGQRIWTASTNIAVDVVISYILLMSLVYIVLDTGVEAVQRRVVAWR